MDKVHAHQLFGLRQKRILDINEAYVVRCVYADNT